MTKYSATRVKIILIFPKLLLIWVLQGVDDGEAGGGAVDLVGISNQMAQSRQLPEPHRFTLQIVVDACSADYVVVSLAGECWFQ